MCQNQYVIKNINTFMHSEPSSTTLVRWMPKVVDVDPTNFQHHIFSVKMLSELVTYLPQCLRVRDGGFPVPPKHPQGLLLCGVPPEDV
jgi:hypothetical protein